MKKAMLARLRSGGFTMIELLIVISILGILAVMVLAAINPVEQINRGRDTATRSDAEQLLGAIERYNAFNNYFPWMTNGNDTTTSVAMRLVNASWEEDAGNCSVLGRLGTLLPGDVVASCVGTQELKDAFITRVDDNGGNVAGGVTPTARGLYVYYEGSPGDNAYVCFSPQSNAFSNEASTRCAGTLPDDLAGVTGVCVTAPAANAAGVVGVDMICLP